MRRIPGIVALLLTWAGAVSADPLVGLWASPPDGKGQTGIVHIRPCGTVYCGTLIKALDPKGREVVTPNVGKRLIWGMRAQGGGAYDGGRVYVPVFRRDYPAQLRLSGGQLTVKGCAAGICKTQHWRPVN